MPDVIPFVTKTGVALGADAVVTLDAALFARKLTGITINGPAKSTFALYIGQLTPSARIDRTTRGESNSNDYSNPLPIPRGSNVYAVWTGQAASATSCIATFRLGS